ncbi:MAG: hypothetical protein HUU36_03395 [Candidatus Omnitrophica bacterium]|nr:hypothetical protein [Candidatus Omnitrophota bacterium]
MSPLHQALSTLFTDGRGRCAFPAPFIANPAHLIVIPNPSIVSPATSIVFPAKAGIQWHPEL